MEEALAVAGVDMVSKYLPTVRECIPRVPNSGNHRFALMAVVRFLNYSWGTIRGLRRRYHELLGQTVIAISFLYDDKVASGG
jgi:hypothetical protein